MTTKEIVTYADLASEMRDLIAMLNQAYAARLAADEAIRVRDDLRQRAEEQERRVFAGMDKLDVRSPGNYGWPQRFLRFMQAMVGSEEAKAEGGDA